MADPFVLSLLAAFAVCGPAPARQVVRVEADTVEALFRGGATFAEFLDRARSRRAQWQRNYAEAVVPEALLARARSAPGAWKLLVVAEDGCSDSVSTIPYIARLTDSVPSIEIRVIDSTVGRFLMEAHRTPDGRAATPTVLLLDASYREVGCWIERPSKLQTWYLEKRGSMRDRELVDSKMQWYAEDAGAETLGEIVEMLETAAAGGVACAGAPQPASGPAILP